jgi:hypothetical protein
MKFIKRYIPHSFKIQLYLLKRKLLDALQNKKYASVITIKDIGDIQTSLTLTIMPSSFFENKVHNLKIVQQKLEGITIYPGEYFLSGNLQVKPVEKMDLKKDGILLPENYLRILVAEFASFHLCYIMQL